MSKEIVLSSDARRRLKNGIDKLANAVKVTLGPRGRNVLISSDYGAPYVTKDGVTVANSIILEDEVENAGAQLIKNAASKMGTEAGDGTTTVTVLTQSLINDGLKAVEMGVSPTFIKRGFDEALNLFIEYVNNHHFEIDESKVSIMKKIASISANGDEEIGDLIANTINKVTKDGVVSVEYSDDIKTSVDITKGMKFDRGYLMPVFINDQKSKECILEDPYILCTDKDINNIQDIVNVLNKAIKSDKSLLIICNEMEGTVLSNIVANLGKLKCCVIKTPGFGNYVKNNLGDIEAATGAKIADIKNIKYSTSFDFLGQAKKVIVSNNSTVIINKPEYKETINERVKLLNEQIDNCSKNNQEEIILKTRLAGLIGGIAIIKVGAASEVEMKEKKDRVDDALCAVMCALEDGVIEGAGYTYVIASNYIKSKCNDKYKDGINIFCKALEAPISQIVENSNAVETNIYSILNSINKHLQYDAEKDEFIPEFKLEDNKNNLLKSFDNRILDPVKVVKNALIYAVSISEMFLTTDCVIVNNK